MLFLGILIGMLVVVNAGLVYILYTKKPKIDHEENKKAERERKHYTNMMSYNADKAYKRKG